MPWMLDEIRGARDLEWIFPDRKTLPRTLSLPSTVPGAEHHPIRITLNGNPATLPDYAMGPLGGTIIVSSRFRTLVAEQDSGNHHFVPVAIQNRDGTPLFPGHFMFKPGSWIEDAIVVEQSDLAEHTIGANTRLMRTRNPARVVWKRDAVGDRHVWTDARFLDGVTVSDEFFQMMKTSGMTGFQALESRFEEAE